jgi:LysM repeat protein
LEREGEIMTHQTDNYLVPHDGVEAKPKRIRCRQCRQSALANLVICPHCGRELHPAPPRLLVWGLPLAVVALFVTAVAGWRSENPATWTADRLGQGWMFVANVGRQIEPRVTMDDVTSLEPQVVVEGSAQENAGAEANGQQPLTVITAQSASVEAASEVPPNQAGMEQAAQSPPVNAEMVITTTLAPTESTETPLPTPTSALTEASMAASAPAATTPVVPTEIPGGGATATKISIPSSTPTATTDASAVETRNVTLTLTATPTRAVNLAQLRAAQTPTSGTAAAASSAQADVQSTDKPVVAAGVATTATPSATPTATPLPTNTPTSTPTTPPLTYEVRAGDTLSAIAARFDTTVDALMQINSLSQQDVRALRPGQVLVIPTSAGAAAAGAQTIPQQSYTVQAGDTPLAIASRFGVSVDALLAINGLSRADATQLRPGQVLVIPDSNP